MMALYVQEGTAYVWNAEDWHILRSKYRISGSLIGTIPSYPRQNDFSGLPMALMSEEATLLVEKGFCTLYELPNITEAPIESVKKEIDSVEKRVLEEQQEAFKKKKIEQLSQKIEIIVTGKKRKLQSKGVTDVDINKETLLHEEINKLQSIAPSFLLVHLPTQHYLKSDLKKVEIDVLKPNIIQQGRSIKYHIFKDLWEKGHHITDGSKFSCDFLVYPGDPVRFHATYMVRCITDQNSSFRPVELVAFGRLSVSVKKMAVLAYCCNGYNDEGIEYQTLQWHDSTNQSLF